MVDSDEIWLLELSLQVRRCLYSAMEIFWNQGFHATSMSDLMKTSGLSSASIYRLYPDKKAIFLAALSQYMDEGLTRMAERASREEPEKALRNTLDYCALLSSGSAGSQGCFIIRAASELLPEDKETEVKVRYMFDGIKKNLKIILSAGQEQGTFRTDTRADVMAESIFMLLEGMRVYGKVSPDFQQLRLSNEFIMQSVLHPSPSVTEP